MILCFSFHHPKAKITSTLYPKVPLSANEKLKLQAIGCKLHFISAAKEIRNLLLSFPPRVSVRDLANRVSLGQTILDVDHLFARDEVTMRNQPFPMQIHLIKIVQFIMCCNEFTFILQTESQFQAPLYDCDKNLIGSIDVSMYLEDHGPCYKSHETASDETLGPPIMDDSLAYKIVEELEIWKERQQEIHLLEVGKVSIFMF